MTHPQARPYQVKLKDDIYNAWDRHDNVMAVSPTGSGKTFTFAEIMAEHTTGGVAAIAHRQELVAQISLALNKTDTPHRIVAPDNVIRYIIKEHVVQCGMSYHDSNGKAGVVGVDTLVRRANSIGRWGDSVNKWVQDEGHHVLADNKWGKAADIFGQAKGLGVTATPVRADGKGLGRHHDGLMDVMVQGPSMRELIDMGYLTDYKIFAPPPNLIMDESDISDATGDYKRTAIVKKFRANKNKIIGDVVEQYIKHANGKLGITFVPDVEDAIDTAKAYNDAGIPAEVVTAKTPANIRAEVIRRFAKRELLQLVNVELCGEGFDLPAIKVVSMARPTASYSLFVQQFGRALRIMDGKIVALIIDHVGNVIRHGLPDAPRVWTLDRRDKRSRGEPDDTIPVKSCPACTGVYERVRSTCPYCGHYPEPVARSGPEFVDGDLFEMDAETLAKMRGDVDAIDGNVKIPYGASGVIQASVRKHHGRTQEMQSSLRESMAWWAGYQESLGREEPERLRRFFFAFGIDALSAKALRRADALELANKINQHIGKLHNEIQQG